METEVLKTEGESCCVCGAAADEELRSPEEHDAAAPPGEPPLRAALLHLNHSKVVPSGRLCESCIRRAMEAYSFSTMLAGKGPPPLSEKIRTLRKRLAELTQKIDVFIVVGGGANGAYSEEDIIAVERGALEAASRDDDLQPKREKNLRGDDVYQCTVCPLTFQQASSYRAHLSTHPSDSLHSCWCCGQQSQSAAALAAHWSSHAACEARGHECASECPVPCPVPEAAARTARLVSQRRARQLVCGYDGCILRFATRSNLLSHIRKCHAEPEPEPAPEPPGAPVPCLPCGRLFSSASSLKRHSRVHRAGPAREQQEGQEWGSELDGKEEYLELDELDDTDIGDV